MNGAQRRQRGRQFEGAAASGAESARSLGRRLTGATTRRALSLAALSLAALPLLAALGCGGGGGGDGGPSGQLLIAVQATAGGVNYWLQNATLTGSGTQSFTLDTDDAGMMASMTQALPPGAYSLRLENGWTLARQMGTSFTPVAGATVTSPNPVSFNVLNAQIARVGFTFDAAGVTVDLSVPADGNDDNDD